MLVEGKGVRRGGSEALEKRESFGLPPVRRAV